MIAIHFHNYIPRCVKKAFDNQCCCNCKYQLHLMGHPWVTGTSINKGTGIYACKVLEEPDRKGQVVISHKHGNCEMWEAR